MRGSFCLDCNEPIRSCDGFYCDDCTKLREEEMKTQMEEYDDGRPIFCCSCGEWVGDAFSCPSCKM